MLFKKPSLMLSCLIMLMLAGAVVPGDAQAETKIAFAATGDGNGEVYVMDADGSNQTNRTNTSGTDEHPVWSPEPPEAVPAISSNGKMALVFLMAGLAAIALFGRQQSWRAGRIREGS